MAWRRNGTKLLGIAGSVYSAGLIALAVIAANPQTSVIVAPRTFAYLSIGNAVLHALTVKRGFTNTRNQST